MRRQNHVGKRTIHNWPGAAWAWEFLRRNPEYQRQYRQSIRRKTTVIQLEIGGSLIRSRRHEPNAIQWGLCHMEDPTISANRANIFWLPQVYDKILTIRLRPSSKSVGQDSLKLSRLNARKSVLETPGHVRQIKLFSQNLWLQLNDPSDMALSSGACLEVQLRRLDTAIDRLKTTQHLLSLFEVEARRSAQQMPKRNNRTLHRYLKAYDIRRAGGSYRDIAIALEGRRRVEEDWYAVSRYLKDRARRASQRGSDYVNGDYLSLLSCKAPKPANH